MLVIILITILILLILYNYLHKNNSLFENLDSQTNTTSETSKTSKTSKSDKENQEEYQHYRNLENDQKNGPVFLALKNAANISALHSQISGINNLKERIGNIENHVKANNKGILSLTNHLNKLGKAISQKPK